MFLILAAAAVLAALWMFTRLAVVAIDRAWPPVGRILEVGELEVHALDLPGSPRLVWP